MPPRNSPTILAIGDSITHRRVLDKLRRRLKDARLRPTFLGTSTSYGVPSEAREGWSWQDFHRHHDVRGEANPFIGAAGRFDFSHYLSSTGQPAPDLVMINLGANDAVERFHGYDFARVREAMEQITDSIRSTCPQARIGIGLAPPAHSPEGEALWHDRFAPMIAAMQDMAERRGDAGLNILPYWEHVDRLSGWKTRVDRTGVEVISDPIHPEEPNRHRIADLTAEWVLGRRLSVAPVGATASAVNGEAAGAAIAVARLDADLITLGTKVDGIAADIAALTADLARVRRDNVRLRARMRALAIVLAVLIVTGAVLIVGGWLDIAG